MSVSNDRIAAAYRNLSAAKKLLADAIETQITAQEVLSSVRFVMTAQGRITGKNADEREANAALMLELETAQLREAEAKVRAAKLAHDLADLEVRAIATEMRLEELLTSPASMPLYQEVPA